jgi:DNA polymerase-3 subunit beta
MQITMQQNELKAALSIALRAIPAKPSNAIFGAVKITAEGNTLLLQSTDFTISINHTAICQTQEPGIACLPAQRLSEVVNALPSNELVTIQVNDKHRAFITCGKAKAEIGGFKPDEYPDIPQTETATTLTQMEGNAFLRLIREGAYAFAKEESRPVLQSVKFDLNGQMSMATADGFRLALCSYDQSIDGDHSLSIPGTSMQAVSSIVDDGSIVTIARTETQACFRSDDTEIITRTLHGEYPSFASVIPTAYEVNAYVSIDEFKQAIKLAGLFSDTPRKIITLEFLEDGIVVNNQQGDNGSGTSVVECQQIDGPATLKMSDAKFILEALQSFDTGPGCVWLRTNPGDYSPLIIQPDESNATALIMPITKR